MFARESYRALELLPPLAPAVGFAERWSGRVSAWWDRSGPETTAGAGTAAAGAGLWSLLGGGAVGLLKTAAVVCSFTAVTVSLCVGVAVVVDDLSTRDPKPDIRLRRTPTPSPVVTATPSPRPTATVLATRTATPGSTDRGPGRERANDSLDTSGESPIPAPAPDGASEFSPTTSSASIDPAPAPDAGGGEFAP